MRTLLVSAAAAALLATSAFAAQHVTGTVKAYDAKAMTITLSDGSTYMLPKTFKDPGLKAGEKVDLSWNQTGKDKVVDTVTITK